MGTELAKAYVQILPSTRGIKGQLTNLLGGEASAAGKSAGGLFSSSLGSAIGLGSKALGGFAGMLGGVFAAGTAAVGAATAGVTALTKAAVSGYGNMEQLRGGAEKIFSGMDFSRIEKDADKAYKELGLSASQYYEAVNLAGATFSQTMGAEKGYEMARRGMFAVSDYATGTGKSIDELTTKFQMITRATGSYQSIADQFSGILPQTSADFLEQAQAAGYLSGSYKKLTAVPVAEYQEAVTRMLEDGVKAIHLTGNTADEAEKTITGSLGMLKASWSNFVTGLADPKADLDPLIDNLSDSFVAAVNNITPALNRALPAVAGSVKTLLPIVTSELPGLIRSVLPDLLDAGGELAEGLADAAPELFAVAVKEAPGVIGRLSGAVEKSAPKLAKAGGKLIEALADGMKQNEPQMLALAQTVFGELLNAMTASLPTLAAGGLSLAPKLLETLLAGTAQNAGEISGAADSILRALGGAVTDSLDLLAEYGPQIVTAFGANLSANAGDYAAGAVKIVSGLASAIGANADALLPAATDAVLAFVGGLADPEMLGSLLDGGEDLVDGLVDGVIASAGLIMDAAPELVNNLADGIVKKLPEAAGFIIGKLVDLLGNKMSGMGLMEMLIDLVTGSFTGGKLPMGLSMFQGQNAGQEFINGWNRAFGNAESDGTGGGGEFGAAVGRDIREGAQGALDGLSDKAGVTAGSIEQAFAGMVIEMNTEGAQKDLDGLKEKVDQIIGLQQRADELADTLKELDGLGADSAVAEKLAAKAQSKVDAFTSGAFSASVSKARTEMTNFVSESDKTVSALEKRLAAVDAKTRTATASITATGELITAQLTNTQTAFVTALDGLPEHVRDVWTKCTDVFAGAQTFFADAGTKSETEFVTPWNAAPGQLYGVWDNIRNIFNKTGEAYVWGYDLAKNYAEGIRKGSGLVYEAATALAGGIKAILGFSEPEEGPLSDFHTYAPDMMALFAQGVADNEAAVREQISRSFDFGEYLNQTGTVDVTGEDGYGSRISLLERILDLLTIIAGNTGRRDGGGMSLEELLELIDEGLGRRAMLQTRE